MLTSASNWQIDLVLCSHLFFFFKKKSRNTDFLMWTLNLNWLKYFLKHCTNSKCLWSRIMGHCCFFFFFSFFWAIVLIFMFQKVILKAFVFILCLTFLQLLNHNRTKEPWHFTVYIAHFMFFWPCQLHFWQWSSLSPLECWVGTLGWCI